MKQSRIKVQSGFTLLEIMISLVIICLVAVSIIQLTSANLRHLFKSDNQIEVLTRANIKMREVLDLDMLEDKFWNEVDDNGYVYDISVTEILKERMDALAVKLMQVTVVARYQKDKPSKQITLRTAKLISKSSALKGSYASTFKEASVY